MLHSYILPHSLPAAGASAKGRCIDVSKAPQRSYPAPRPSARARPPRLHLATPSFILPPLPASQGPTCSRPCRDQGRPAAPPQPQRPGPLLFPLHLPLLLLPTYHGQPISEGPTAGGQAQIRAFLLLACLLLNAHLSPSKGPNAGGQADLKAYLLLSTTSCRPVALLPPNLRHPLPATGVIGQCGLGECCCQDAACWTSAAAAPVRVVNLIIVIIVVGEASELLPPCDSDSPVCTRIGGINTLGFAGWAHRDGFRPGMATINRIIWHGCPFVPSTIPLTSSSRSDCLSVN